MKYQDPGIILLDKQSGLSSAKAIAGLKRRLNLKKVGHSGTLDPMATGLLVCLINSATRLAAYAESGEKVYSGTIDFGISTDTDDIEGTVLEKSENAPKIEAVRRRVAEKFIGEIEQIPPQVSAVKVNGTRAYKLAREGVRTELQTRSITIKDFTVDVVSERRISFLIRCSKGTYIRALARDLGREFSCGACLSALRREQSFPFSVENAKELENLTIDEVLDWRVLFPEVPVVELDARITSRLVAGDRNALRRLDQFTLDANLSCQRMIYSDHQSGKALGLLIKDGREWKFGLNCCASGYSSCHE